MPQSARDNRLETRSARLRLASGTRYFKTVGEGLTLVYRRTGDGFGTWSAKIRLADGKYLMRALGTADDYQDANAVDVLTFWEAQEQARQLANQAKIDIGVVLKPRTVRDAAEAYMAWFRDHRKSVGSTAHVVRTHILPHLGEKRLNELSTAHIREWQGQIATAPARLRCSSRSIPKFRSAPTTEDEKRARRATTNRILTVLKAILNRAFESGMVMYDERTTLSRQVATDLRSFFGTQVLQSVIPRNVRLAEAPSFGKPIIFYDIHSKGAEGYTQLAQEVIANAEKRAGTGARSAHSGV